MTPIQATITISRGRIQSIEEKPGGVTIISEAGTHEYPDAWALPGLVDAHAHIFGLGMKLTGLSLYTALSAKECVQRALQHNFFHSNWINGMGWNQELWESREFPTIDLLDEAFPNAPVFLTRADGHAAWVNSVALKIAGINDETPDPVGGTILRDSNKKATGILIDNAMELVRDHIPKYTTEQQILLLKTAAEELIALGVTEVHDMDVDVELLPLFREMAETATLPIRVQSYVRAQNDEWLHAGVLPNTGEFQRTCGVKYFIDGALGSRGAALLQPYSDAPETTGLFLLTEDELFKKASRALEDGWQISTHAIGDAANRAVLNVYEKLRKNNEDAFLRMEHAQIVHPDDVPRFKENNIKVLVQPIHCTSDAPMAEERLGERCEYSYPWRTLRNTGITFGGGSDFPIELHEPLTGIDAFCRRLPFGSDKAWYPKEIITREEALFAYTAWAHETSEMEYRRGFLKTGFDADIVLHDTNLLTCADDEILKTKVVATYTAGALRFKNEDF